MMELSPQNKQLVKDVEALRTAALKLADMVEAVGFIDISCTYTTILSYKMKEIFDQAAEVKRLCGGE